MFPFSVGEWMIAAGVLIIIIAVILGMFLCIWRVLKLVKGKPSGEKGCSSFIKGVYGYFRFFVWVLLSVSMIMTLNCFILYHASTFSESYFADETEEYSYEELFSLYNRVAAECNTLCDTMERDEEGNVVYVGRDRTMVNVEYELQLRDMADEARNLMKELGKEYDQLDGWYPRPKAMFFSDFMCQQHMQGYYFPFSMEANYNAVMYILNIPATMCHELAHLRGYIYEDEANFIGYLACARAEDDFFRYSGNLSVLVYLYNDIYKLYTKNRSAFEETMAEVPLVAVKKQVWEDNLFVSEEEWERINKKAVIDTETVDKAADVFIETNLKVNGVSDGKTSYSRVVRLLLQYYRQEGAK